MQLSHAALVHVVEALMTAVVVLAVVAHARGTLVAVALTVAARTVAAQAGEVLALVALAPLAVPALLAVFPLLAVVRLRSAHQHRLPESHPQFAQNHASHRCHSE